ncbi:hypothetical protein GCM10008921_02660 [Metaclostridioides mangenotii]
MGSRNRVSPYILHYVLYIMKRHRFMWCFFIVNFGVDKTIPLIWVSITKKGYTRRVDSTDKKLSERLRRIRADK